MNSDRIAFRSLASEFNYGMHNVLVEIGQRQLFIEATIDQAFTQEQRKCIITSYHQVEIDFNCDNDNWSVHNDDEHMK